MRTHFRVLDLVVVFTFARCAIVAPASPRCHVIVNRCVVECCFIGLRHLLPVKTSLQFKTIDVLGLQACITMHQRSWCVFNCSLHSVRSMVLRFLTAAIGICGFQSVYSNHRNFRWHRCLYFEKPTKTVVSKNRFFPVNRFTVTAYD